MNESALLLAWVSRIHCDGTVLSAGFWRGREVVLKGVGGFLGSPFTLIGISTTPLEGTVNGESAFIAVDGECSGVDEEWGEGRLSSGAETERMKCVLLASSEFCARYGGGGAGLCAVEQSVETKKCINYQCPSWSLKAFWL